MSATFNLHPSNDRASNATTNTVTANYATQTLVSEEALLGAETLPPTNQAGTPYYNPGNISKRQIDSKLELDFSFVSEDNNSMQHLPGASSPVPSSYHGARIWIKLVPSGGKTTNDAYLTDIVLATNKGAGTYYVKNNNGEFIAIGDEVIELTENSVTHGPLNNKYIIERYEEIDNGNTIDVLQIRIENENVGYLNDTAMELGQKMAVDLSELELYFMPGKDSTPGTEGGSGSEATDFTDSDADIEFDCSISIANHKGRNTTEGGLVGEITVDAVADCPKYQNDSIADIIFTPHHDEEQTVESVYDNGVVLQTVGGGQLGADEQTVLALGEVEFGDYTDDSEEHFVLIACKSPTADWRVDLTALGQGDYAALVPPAAGALDKVWLGVDGKLSTEATTDAIEYYKIVINNEYLEGNSGKVNLNLPVIIGANTGGGVHQFDLKLGAKELQVPVEPTEEHGIMEIDEDNNLALVDVPVNVTVLATVSEINVSTGWAYESGADAAGPDNPNADPATSSAEGGHTGGFRPSGTGGETANVSAAFIKVDIPEAIPGETVGDWVVLTYDSSRGDVFLPNGRQISSSNADGSSYVTISRTAYEAEIGGELVLYFVPNPNDDNDADVNIKYELSVTIEGEGGAGRVINLSNEIPIVIDAVADDAKVTVAPSGTAPDFEGFTLDYTATFKADASETQYVVIANPGGLLSLEDLGPLASHFTPVQLAELLAFENPDPAAAHYFDSIGTGDIILRVNNLNALDLQDGTADGKVNFKLPFTVTDKTVAGNQLNVSISTVVVDGKGNNAGNWAQEKPGDVPSEHDFANNIAVTQETAVVNLVSGAHTAIVERPVYEGDQDEQHLHGNADAPEYGTAINMQFTNPCEALHEISFTMKTAAGGTNVDGSMAFGLGTDYTLVPSGGSLRFTAEPGGANNDEARYTSAQVLDATGNIIKEYIISVPATLQALNAQGNASGLRFIPTGDSDEDVKIDFTARVFDVRSGDVITVRDSLPVITRDAVADLPTDVASSITSITAGHTAVVSGNTVTVSVAATFGDYTQGTESQYLFVSKDSLASVTVPPAFAGSFTLLDNAAAATVCSRVDGAGGIVGADPAAYFVIKVDPGYLNTHSGKVDLPLEVSLRADLAKDGTAVLDIKTVALEYEGFLTPTGVDTGGNVESSAANNVAVADAPATIIWATLENTVDITVAGPASENDQPDQNTGDTTLEGGAGIRIAPEDGSEVFDTLLLAYQAEDSQAASGKLVLSANGQSLEIPSGTTLNFTYDADNPALCVQVSYTDGSGTHSLNVPKLTLDALTSQGLRYVPDSSGNDSDVDVNVTISGTTRETESGETGVYAATTVQVMVDAAADKADGVKTFYDYSQQGLDSNGNPFAAIPVNGPVSFNVGTTFHDYTDSSETHYLFVNTKFLADGTVTLIDTTTNLPFAGGTPVSGSALADLYNQINGTPGLIPQSVDNYMVLEISPSYLQAHGGVLGLTVKGTLKDVEQLKVLGPEKHLLDMDVKAIAVEYAGYLTPEAGTASGVNDEHTATNNVSVTDIGTQFYWDALQNEFTPVSGWASEGDQPSQHSGDLSFAGGGALTITPADASEVFTQMTLNYDNTHGNVVLSANNASGTPVSLVVDPNVATTFTFDSTDPTRIVSVSTAGGSLDVYAADGTRGMTLAELTASGLRYVPQAGDNDDADISITIEADTLDANSGTTGQTTLNTLLGVDAVADMPQNISAALQVTNGKNNTVILNEAQGIDSFDIAVVATFNDYEDGSEGHYIFVSREYLSSLEGLPSGITQLPDMSAAGILANAGLSSGSGYFVLEVSDSYLQTNSGVVNTNLTAHLNGMSLPDENVALQVDIKAGAIEHQGYNTPVDGTDLGNGHGLDGEATNNVSLVDIGIELHYARVDNIFTVAVSNVYEGDAPGQHTGNYSLAGGATIDFSPQDTSEVFDTLVLNYDDSEGQIYLDLSVSGAGNTRLTLDDGAQLDFVYRNEGAGATQCTKVTVTTNGVFSTYTLTNPLPLQDLLGDDRMHYIPEATSQSDRDVTVNLSGTTRETATGETGTFDHDVSVKVDAVADKPDATGAVASSNGVHTSLAPSTPFDVTVQADFGDDLADGSEVHYVFISKKYLDSINVPAAQSSMVTLLSEADATAVCAQVAGSSGIPGASSSDYFVLKVNPVWLQTNNGSVNLVLEGALKNADELTKAGGAEGSTLNLEMKAVAVEHQGFLTLTTDDLGVNHGHDLLADNNVAVDDASTPFTYAMLDGVITATVASAYEGDQKHQDTGDWATIEGGATITLAPSDSSEIFEDLTLNYDDANGKLTLTGLNGSVATLDAGAKIEFSYDPAHPTECLSVLVYRSGDSSPFVTQSFRDPATGRGLSLEDLTSGYLRYVPTTGDNHDTDVAVQYSGTVAETESDAKSLVTGSLTVVVDAVADRPENAAGSASVVTPGGARPGAIAGETVTIAIEAEFKDYGAGDVTDTSEGHYIFIAKEHLASLGSIPGYVNQISDPVELARIFDAIETSGGSGIHAGFSASTEYYVLEVSPQYLRDNNGAFSMSLTTQAGADGVYAVDARAVAIEHDGYRTDVSSINGGTDCDVTAENNVAEADISFNVVVRSFTPEKIKIELASEWAFENDRSAGHEQYYPPNSTEGRDHGVQLIFSEGPGEGNVVSSITLEYDMPSNGSATPHKIESFVGDTVNPDVAINYDLSTPGKTKVTVTSTKPYGSVGELRFVAGDNYDNADADITVLNVQVSDPLLHMTTDGVLDWGNGLAPDAEDQLHVKVDAVAQKPEVNITGLDHDSGNPVEAGGVIHINGQVSFEDTSDGSEQHFILVEIQDGYYPDSVTLSYKGQTSTINVQHYSSDPEVNANYTLQELVTPDDNLPHLFIKLPADAELAELMGGTAYERMDDIAMDVTYQTRDWAQEGAALHFAAIAAEDVEGVREFDANWNITNDELPFDQQLVKYCPGLQVTPNNTAITVDTGAAYVFWDSSEPEDVTFKGYVSENDRPSDNQRDPAYILNRQTVNGVVTTVESYPVALDLQPFDSQTGRDFGTGMELNIPAHATQVTLSATSNNMGQGDFYFLPETVWTAYMTSPAPLADTGIARYKVVLDTPATAVPGDGEYRLVFIPKHEPYDSSHTETNDSHKDYDFRFNYEILADQYSPTGNLIGTKKFVGEDEVIRTDAVANQAEIILAGDPDSAAEFSLWAGRNTISSFPLTVGFHDLDGTEDHYVLVEMVPNFAFRCGSYTYSPGTPGSISPSDEKAVYTHVVTNAQGTQTTKKYYKVPVDLADIDPATGEVTVQVEFIRQPGMPAVADYPSSELLTYGALTEDQTCSRWDSQDPTADNFINRLGADGEYSYENNTSVLIRNGIVNGDPTDGSFNPGGFDDISGPTIGGGTGGGYIHWENGPGGGWSDGWWPRGHETGGGLYWKKGGPAGGGDWWRPGGGIETSSGHIDEWLPAGGGAWTQLGGGASGGGGGIIVGGGGGGGDSTTNKWIASRSQGLAAEWVFENSTPLGNTEAGQYNCVMPTSIYLTGDNPNAEYVTITIPGVDERMINSVAGKPFYDGTKYMLHSRGTLGISSGAIQTVTDSVTGDITYTIHAPGGKLPAGANLFFLASPDCLGEDIQLDVKWYNQSKVELSAGTLDIMVDAVAQWANFAFDQDGGIYGVSGKDPRELLTVTLETAFLDLDGSESNYVLVEKLPGVLPLHANAGGGYDTLREVYLEGKTYYIIEPSLAEQVANKVSLEISVNEELTSPMYISDDIVYNNSLYSGMRLNVGTMTLEGQTGKPGIGSDPANWEYTLSNNVALNLKEDALSIIISNANAKGGNSAVMVVETDAPEDHLLWLDPANPATALNLTMDGNDILKSLVFTEISGNGDFWYEDSNGVHHPVTVGVNMVDAYLAGKIYHKQDRYQDSDAYLKWDARVEDGLTTSSVAVVSGKHTVGVDAVAKSEEIHQSFPVLDKDAGTMTLNLTFDDHEANEAHYAVIAPDLYRVVGKNAVVFGADGTAHNVNVETIFDPSGTPYYAVSVNGYLDSAGAVKVQFEMHELNIAGIQNFPVICGGVSMEPNAGYNANDREMNISNNWAINTEVNFVHSGVVENNDLAFTMTAITENNTHGTPITLSGTLGENNIIQSATLSFTPQTGTPPFVGNAGDQIATIVYKDQCIAVTLDATGKASASVPFDQSSSKSVGFDSAADFRVIWGVAHMQDSTLVVDSWNHAASGVLDLDASYIMKNLLTGQTKTFTSVDPDGVTLTGRADNALDVSGEVSAINGNAALPTDPVGAAEDTVTVTVNGKFEDLDGSETHALLVEVPTDWQVLTPLTGKYETVEGVRYYSVDVDSKEGTPSVDITFKSPDGLNSNVELKTAVLVTEDNAHTMFTQGDAVTLHMSDVSATDLTVTTASIAEDTLFSLAAMADAVLEGADSNDELQSITFTDLKGGNITDAAGHISALQTFTRAELASGQYFYKPVVNYAGELDALGKPLPIALKYDALLGETDTGARAALTDRTLHVTVVPEADMPEGISGSTGTLGSVQSGHKAALSLTLNADFSDVDGSESHFFVVSAPAGVAVVNGAGYTVLPITDADVTAMGLPAGQLPGGSPMFKITLNDSTLASASLAVNLEVTTTVYNNGSLHVVGGSAELRQDDTHSYSFAAVQSVTLPSSMDPAIGNLNPVAAASVASLNTLRGGGRVSLGIATDVDPDDDVILASGLSFGATAGTAGTVDGKNCYSVRGMYGILHFFDDGTYSYILDSGQTGISGQEVFDYTIKDGYGGSGQSTITINLDNANAAPSATPVGTRLDSLRRTEVGGDLLISDSDGDDIAVVSINNGSTANNTLQNFGTLDAPEWGFALAGSYGTLQVYEDATGHWKYRYTLDSAHRGEANDESFTFTVQDAYGLETTSSIVIDLFNNNSAPVAGEATTTLDTLRDADDVAAGYVALTDSDNDTVKLSAVTGPNGAVGHLGVDGNGVEAFVVQGQYGKLYLYATTESALQYRYVFTDPVGRTATESFTYTVNDGNLGTASNTITINLSNANNDPEIAGTLSTELDTLRTTTGQTGGALIFRDQDYNVDKARYDLTALSNISFNGTNGTADGLGGFTVNGAHGVLQINASGNYTYKLNSGEAGTAGAEKFTVTLADEFGASQSETLTVDLVTRNQNPTASAGSLSLNTWRGGNNAGNVVLADLDGDTVTVNAVAGANPGTWGVDENNVPSFVVAGTHGMLYVQTNGNYHYVLNADAKGVSATEVFTYNVKDDYRGSASSTITIDLSNANSAPVLSGKLETTVQGSLEDYQNGVVQESGQFSWADADGDAIASVTVGGTSLQSSGAITVDGLYGKLLVTAAGDGTGASYTYTLNAGLDENGIRAADNFAIEVTDIYGGKQPGQLVVNLTPLSHSPVCSDVNMNWPKLPNGLPQSSISGGRLSFKDADMQYDPSETLQLTVNDTDIFSSTTVAGKYGVLTINQQGVFSYNTTQLNENLVESFTYSVTDKAGNIAEAHLHIRLSDNAPAFPNTGTTDEGVIPVVTAQTMSLDDLLAFAELSGLGDMGAAAVASHLMFFGEQADTNEAVADMASAEATVFLSGVPMPLDAMEMYTAFTADA